MVFMAVWGAGLGVTGVYSQSAILRAGREYKDAANGLTVLTIQLGITVGALGSSAPALAARRKIRRRNLVSRTRASSLSFPADSRCCRASKYSRPSDHTTTSPSTTQPAESFRSPRPRLPGTSVLSLPCRDHRLVPPCSLKPERGMLTAMCRRGLYGVRFSVDVPVIGASWSGTSSAASRSLSCASTASVT